MSSQALLDRARTALFQQSEVTLELCEAAYAEAVDLTNNRPISQTMLLDLAYMRLKLRLKVEVDDIESKLAFAAIKAAEKLPPITKSIESLIPVGARVNERVSEWDTENGIYRFIYCGYQYF